MIGRAELQTPLEISPLLDRQAQNFKEFITPGKIELF